MRASVQRVLDKLTVPAVVVNSQQDLVAANLMGRALLSPHFEADRPNLARFIFLDSRARDYYVDWALACSLTAAMLRYQAGRDPLNSDLTAAVLVDVLVGPVLAELGAAHRQLADENRPTRDAHRASAGLSALRREAGSSAVGRSAP